MSRRISDETELIQTYLAPLAAPGAFGLHDDAALLETRPGFDLVVSTDPIIAGVHFFPDDDPRDIAWKALAVNVSDLIAKGAAPAGYTMALAFPEAPLTSWIDAFSVGLRDAQEAFGCPLFGGDTDRTPGPLSIGVSVFGFVPQGCFVKRTTARIGDHVFVTGTIGDAALGLKLRRDVSAFGPAFPSEHRDALLARYLRPQPSLTAINLISRFATAALDISDGLLQDAARLARGANARLAIPVASVPLSKAACCVVSNIPDALAAIVSGGDDYAVLFSVAPDNVADMRNAAAAIGQDIFSLGVLETGAGVAVHDTHGISIVLPAAGYDHFRT